jgi:hypothetical protein
MLADMSTSTLAEHHSHHNVAASTFDYSVVPMIDEVIARVAGRGFLSSVEVVDVLLDLRLLATADDLVAIGE